jgi:hypothetical protein
MPSDFPGAPTFEPGQSPFRGKGLIYLGSQEFAEKHLPGGWATVLEQLRAHPALVRFLEQRFLAASWYDALPMAHLTRAGARAAGTSFASFSRRRAEWQAEHDAHGVYRTLLRLTSPDVVVERIVRLTPQIFEFGTTTFERLGDKHFRVTRGGVPLPLVDWYTAMSEPYSLRLLTLSGAQQPVFRPDAVAPPDAIEHGMPTKTIAYEASWL